LKTLKNLYKKWLAIGKRIANVQIRVFFTLFYVLVIIPFGYILKLTGKERPDTGWRKADRDDTGLAAARRLF